MMMIKKIIKLSGIKRFNKKIQVSEKLKAYKLASITLRGLIKSKINYVIERRVKKFVFENRNINLFKNEETIFLFGKSKFFKTILLKAKKNNDKMCQKFL